MTLKNKKTIIVVIIAVIIILTTIGGALVLNSNNKSVSSIWFYGYFIKTDSDSFAVIENSSSTFSKGELIKLQYEGLNIDVDNYCTGDKIKFLCQMVGDLSPRVAFVIEIEEEEQGSLNDIDPIIVDMLKEKGYSIL